MRRILALCGGVGGAKLAFGLAQVLQPFELTIAVNIGDDFTHLGLHISPDIDTVLYTLACLADRERGWGLAGETWQFMSALSALGGPTWFQLGDRDLAMHVERTTRLARGETLSAITSAFANQLNILQAVLPASDDPMRTIVDTDRGELSFQEYFVRDACEPAIVGLRYSGAVSALPATTLMRILEDKHLSAVVICPSNPYLSVAPMLAMPALRESIAALQVPRIAISPLVAGRAIKGPTAKVMIELGLTPGIKSIADFYDGLIDGLVIDESDIHEAAAIEQCGVATLVTGIVMRSDKDRVRLARETLAFASSLETRHRSFDRAAE